MPIRVHWTLLLALPYIALLFVAQLTRGDGARLPAATAWLLGGSLAVGLFVGVALHELAHTLVGIRLGARVKGITLLFLGGVSEMSRPPSTAWREVVMAAVGPIASLIIAALAHLGARVVPGIGGRALDMFAGVNLVIGLFNLLPAFPLDGGRVLRGLLARPLGKIRATKIAAAVGKVLAVALAVLGLFGGNLFLVVIAGFIYFGAGAEAAASDLDARLQTIRVSELVDPRVALIDAYATAAQAARSMAATGRSLLLVEQAGHIIGQVRAQAIERVPPQRREIVPVASLMTATSAAAAPDEPASRALERMRELGLDTLPVLDGDHLLGLLSLPEVMRLLELRRLGHPA